MGGSAVLHDLLHRICFLESAAKAATTSGLILPHMHSVYWLTKHSCALWELICATRK
jgi:hypothetical protein